MKLTKTSCLELVKKYVVGIENVKLKDMKNYRYFSEKRNLHFHFTIFVSDDYELKVMVCNRKYGDVMIWMTLFHYHDIYLDGRIVISTCAFHIGIDEEIAYSTNRIEKFDVSYCLSLFD